MIQRKAKKKERLNPSIYYHYKRANSHRSMSAEVENKTVGRLLMGGQEHHAFALVFNMHSQCLYGWERRGIGLC